MRRASLPLLLALLFAGLGGAPAHAADPSASSPDADVLFHKGAAAYDGGKYAEAFDLLSQAWGLKQTHDIAGNLAQAELKLGKKREAAGHIAFALAHYPPTVAAQNDKREGMKKVLDGLRKELGVLHISVNVSDVYLSLDDRFLGRSPIEGEVFVDAGEHVIQARLLGFLPKDAKVSVAKGAVQEVALEMVKPEVAPVPPVKPSSTSAPPPPPMPAVPPESRSLVPGIVLGGTAGAALITGIVLLVDAGAKGANATTLRDQILNDTRSCVPGAGNYDARCGDVSSLTSSGDTMNRAGIGLLVGAGALAAGTAIYFLWPTKGKDPKTRQGLHIIPAGSAKEAGVLFSGSF